MVSNPYELGRFHRQVTEHERRLNSINGSIEGLREDVDTKLDEFDEKLTSVFVWMKVAFILGQILTPVIVGTVIYLVVR